MRLYWIAYQLDGKTLVVIQPGASLVSARMKVAIGELGAAYVAGHEPDDKTAAELPEELIGCPLSRSEAAKLLARLER